MPVNAPPEYYKAKEQYESAKTREEKIAALEEMIRVLPKHKGAEHLLASIRSKIAKLKKESAKKAKKQIGIKKEGEAQVCVVGFTNSGKSTLLKKITDAKPEIAPYEYTTTAPFIGMMDYKGLKIQIIEIPATFAPRDMSIARTSDLIVLLARTEDEYTQLKQVLKNHFIRTKIMRIRHEEKKEEIVTRIWKALDLIAVYTHKTKTAMALPHNATVKDFAERIHKDFVKNFRAARLWRKIKQKTVVRQVGLNYMLEDGDVVEIYTN